MAEGKRVLIIGEHPIRGNITKQFEERGALVSHVFVCAPASASSLAMGSTLDNPIPSPGLPSLMPPQLVTPLTLLLPASLTLTR